MNKTKVPAAPATKSKSTKHATFADPLFSVLGEPLVVVCGIFSLSTNPEDVLTLSHETSPLFIGPMLNGLLLCGYQGAVGEASRRHQPGRGDNQEHGSFGQHQPLL